jgi:hypothetical protein
MNKKVMFFGGYIICSVSLLFAQSRLLTEEESEQLSHSVAKVPVSNIDVMLQRTKIQFGNRAAATREMGQDGLELLRERLPGKTITVKTMGTFLPTGEYEIVTQERIRLFGMGKFRNDIQYYDSLTGKIKEDRTNIAHLTVPQKESTFFVIDHLINRMEIDNISRFSPHFEVLTYGTLNYSLNEIFDILRAAKNKSEKKLYINTTNSGRASEVIECLDARQRKLYEIQVDPNDIGMCYELSIFDVDSGKLKKRVEYSDFITGKDFVRPYPRKIVTTDFTDGNITEQETVEIKKVSFMKNAPDIFDPQEIIEGKKMEIEDRRAKKLYDANESESQH